MLTAALGAAATIVAALLGLGFKLWLASRAKPAQTVAEVDHAIIQDAANRPDDDAAIARLQRHDA